MAYFKLNGIDYSSFVQELEISQKHNYNSATNASGDTVVDYINSKREIEVTFIPMFDQDASHILTEVQDLVVTCAFLDPLTGSLTTITGIVPDNSIEYYTIQSTKCLIDKFKMKIKEL